MRRTKIIGRNTKTRLGADMGQLVEKIHYDSLETVGNILPIDTA